MQVPFLQQSCRMYVNYVETDEKKSVKSWPIFQDINIDIECIVAMHINMEILLVISLSGVQSLK